MRKIVIGCIAVSFEVFRRYRVEWSLSVHGSDQIDRSFFRYKNAQSWCMENARRQAHENYGKIVFAQVRDLANDTIPFHGNIMYGDEVVVTETSSFVDNRSK